MIDLIKGRWRWRVMGPLSPDKLDIFFLAAFSRIVYGRDVRRSKVSSRESLRQRAEHFEGSSDQPKLHPAQ
jgi:hypothetical protein